MRDDNEHDLDLFWHALNYRTASTEHAQRCWEELEQCVSRIVAQSLRQQAEAVKRIIGI